MNKITSEQTVIMPEDERLADQAYQKLSEIFSKNFENAMTESGQYLIETFFNNDIEAARNKKSSKEVSLNQLIKKLQNGDDKSPSKTWMYNSIGLIIQNHDIEKEGSEIFRTYGNLLLSHKIVILTAKEINIKLTMIKESADKNFTVRELKDLKKTLIPPTIKSASLLSLLDSPDKLFDDKNNDMKDILSRGNIEKLSYKKREAIRNKAITKEGELEKEINNLTAEIKKQKKYIRKIKQLSKDLGKNVENEST